THDIAVNVSRRGTTVRARREFTAEPTSAPKTPDRVLTATLRSPLTSSDFGVKATTFSYRDDESGRIKVIVCAELDRSMNRSEPFAVGYYVTNSHGEVVTANVEKSLAVPAGQEGQPQYFMSAVLLDPGTYVVRLAAVDQQGRKASVEHTFDASLTAIGQLRMSALMLGRPG